MKIGIMSDTHDNIWALSEAIEALGECDSIVHCGDLNSPFVMKQLGEGFPGLPVHLVWGNNDGDLFNLSRMASNYANVVLHGALGEITLDSLRVAINHYPEIARPLAESGRYDLVVYGHDHLAHGGWVGDCLLLNPGEVMGLNGRRSVAVVQTPGPEAEFIELVS